MHQGENDVVCVKFANSRTVESALPAEIWLSLVAPVDENSAVMAEGLCQSDPHSQKRHLDANYSDFLEYKNAQIINIQRYKMKIDKVGQV